MLKIFCALVIALGLAENSFAQDLNFNAESYEVKEINNIAFRAYENICYVSRPLEPEYQVMSIYIPVEYFKDGGTVNNYSAETAPIFMPNGVGGYMPGRIAAPGFGRDGKANASLNALARGYVVAAPAIRGRTLTHGKAPALIVDYKAAVRYLRYIKRLNLLPAGDTDKIISNGTSAGGALSALLGATGNAAEYKKYLDEIGAADERDDIFAAMAYCPITDLDHADMAYEWIFNGINEYHQAKMLRPMNGGGNNRPENAPLDTKAAALMSEVQIAASNKLKAMYPDYLNSLKLKDAQGNLLTLDTNGEGSFKEFIKNIYIAAAQGALDADKSALNNIKCFEVEGDRVVSMDLKAYAEWATRLKAAPAFDALDNSSGENNEFGDESIEAQHFTAFAYYNSLVDAGMADEAIIKLLNPLNFIGRDGVNTAKHWRIRHGVLDRDTVLAVPAVLALKLLNNNCTVDFKAAWGYGHAGDYDLNGLFDWIDSICR